MRRKSHVEVRDAGRQHPWVVVGADKYVSRKNRRASQSRWNVTFRNIRTGKTVQGIVAAQSKLALDAPRSDRYEDRYGSTAVVKDLEPRSVYHASFPALVLKSFHQPVWHGETGHDVDVNNLKKSAHYFNLQGYCSYVGQHSDFSHMTNAGQVKPFVIMEKIGDGLDLYALTQHTHNRRKVIESDEARQKFISAMCRFMAVLERFHVAEGRPVLDLKMENIMPIRDERGHIVRLVLIDLDNSFGEKTQFTPEALSLADFEQVRRSWNHASKLDGSIDFRSLGQALAESVYGISPGEYFTIHNQSHPLFRLSSRYMLTTVSVVRRKLGTSLVTFYQALAGTAPGQSARDIIAAAFGREEAPYYLSQFDEEAANLQGREVAMAQAMTADSPSRGVVAFPPATAPVARHAGGSPRLFRSTSEQALLTITGAPALAPLEVDSETPVKKSCAASICEAMQRLVRR
ncbi:MAG: hypothetical protein P1U63_09130 [Coxiellaceae bacterium]|nr:hypothetical protein [Coxiellaceae bacterium]